MQHNPHHIRVLVFLTVITLFCSCTHLLTERDMEWCYGVESLRPENIKKLASGYKKNKPQTVKELSNLLGSKPLSTYVSGRLTYSFWEWHQWNAGSKTYLCYCVSVSHNGDIIKSGIRWSQNTPGQPEGKYGDNDLVDPTGTTHSEVKLASRASFMAKEISRAKYMGRTVRFSADGLTSRLLLPTERFIRWDGDQAVVYNTATGQMDYGYRRQGENERVDTPPAQPAQPSKGLVFLDALVDALGNSAVQYTSSPSPEPASPRPNRSAEEFMEYSRRLQKKADDAREKTEEMRRKSIIERSGFRCS